MKTRKGDFTGRILGLLLLTGSLFGLYGCGEKGVKDYRIVERQYTEMDTGKYIYLEELTLSYVELEGLKEEVQEKINQEIYASVFQRANYWHYEPNETVKGLQEEYSVYADHVICQADYYSQYLISINFEEYYTPLDLVHSLKLTRWGMNFDLLTGEEYRLGDIFYINEDFARFWVEKLFEEDEWEEEYVDHALEWLSGEASVEEYDIVPFFYLTVEGNFVIGAALNPTAVGADYGEPEDNSIFIEVSYEEVKDYATDSLFWTRYEKSEPAGELIENAEFQDNAWIGEDGSVWAFWEQRRSE